MASSRLWQAASHDVRADSIATRIARSVLARSAPVGTRRENPFPARPPRRSFIWADRVFDANEIDCRSDELRFRDRLFFSGPTARTASGCSRPDGNRAAAPLLRAAGAGPPHRSRRSPCRHIDQVRMREPAGTLVVRLAVGEHLALHHARFDERVERAIDRGDADAMAIGGAAMDLAHAGMIVRPSSTSRMMRRCSVSRRPRCTQRASSGDKLTA